MPLTTLNQGAVADGSAASGYPVEMGGTDANGNLQTMQVSPQGEVQTESGAIRRLLEAILIELRLMRGDL